MPVENKPIPGSRLTLFRSTQAQIRLMRTWILGTSSCPAEASSGIRRPALEALDYDAKNYDAIVLVGLCLGGEGIFRSLVAQRAWTPISTGSLRPTRAGS